MQAPIKTPEQFDAMLAFTATRERPEMYRLMLLLSIRLGMRPMEIAALHTTWVREVVLRIPIGHAKGKKKGRSLGWTPELDLALREHMQGREGRVFLNRMGEPMDAGAISSALRRLYREAGQLGSCYSGRRSMATGMVEDGVSAFVVQKALGHSSIVTTMSYVAVTDEQVYRAMHCR